MISDIRPKQPKEGNSMTDAEEGVVWRVAAILEGMKRWRRVGAEDSLLFHCFKGKTRIHGTTIIISELYTTTNITFDTVCPVMWKAVLRQK